MATSKTNFQVGNACEKCEVYKMATLLGITRGLSLNLGWDKCDVWLVDQWVPFSLCAFVCLIVDSSLRDLIWLSLMHVWLLCSFEALTTDYIDWSSCLSSHIVFPCCMITLLTMTCIFSLLLISSSWYLDFFLLCTI